MTKRWIISMLACGMLAAGCGQKQEDVEVPEFHTGESEETLQQAEEENILREYEERYSRGEANAEDYRALAAIYGERGSVRRQRDLLEQSYRLFADEEALHALSDISVNLEEEDDAIRSMAELMLQNLELEEYRDEAVNMITAGEWFETMMPKLHEGKRSYFLNRNGETVLVIEAGYEAGGKPYSDVWYTAGEGEMIWLRYADEELQMLKSGVSGGTYNGAFEAWTVAGNTGDIFHEQGTFAAGLLSGEYTAGIHTGNAASEVYALWCNREDMEYALYTGEFDEQGQTKLDQPEEKALQELYKNIQNDACVVYAYNEKKDSCLFIGLEEGMEPASYAFASRTFGYEERPAIATYDVAAGEDTEQYDVASDEATASVRIFDGEVQVLVENRWVSAGSVTELAKSDPFRAYAQGETTANTEVNENDDNTGAAEGAEKDEPIRSFRMVGTIKKEEPKPSTPTRTTKPATPAPEPEPTPAPSNPEPTPAPSNPEPSPAPSNPEPSPAPSNPEPTPAPNEGNDTDIEWTDDIL